MLIGSALALGVLAPLLGHGWLLVLDWVNGPHHGLAPGYWGLGFPPGPLPALIVASEAVVHGPFVSWLVIALCFPVAAWGVARLIPGGVVARSAGAVLYTVNPFVFERLAAGQIFVLVSYALVPFLVGSLLASERSTGLRRLAPAVWLAAVAAPAIHFAWIGALVLLVVVACRHRWTAVLWGLEVLAVTALLDAYLLIPIVAGGQSIAGASGGPADLAAFQTAGDDRWGLFVNVAGLYGFWRQGFVTLPKDRLSGWPVLLGALLLVVAVGLVSAWRRGRRALVGALVISGVAGYLLALGSQGPTGGFFRLLYEHLPGFDVLREPEKFVSLIALTYAVGFGLGVEVVVGRLGRPATRGAMASLLLVIPLVYTPTIFDGLDGQLHTSVYPASWVAADRLMGRGPGQILFLPWQEYLSFPFTHGQVVANPAAELFHRPVISGDDPDLGPGVADSGSARSAYLEALFARGPQLRRFGHLVAQLGVRYVVLSDAGDGARSTYSWVGRQSDLTRVFDRNGLQVWRDDAALSEGARLTSTLHVGSVSAYISLAERESLVGTAVFIDPRSAGRRAAGQGLRAGSGRDAGRRPDPVEDVRRTSATSYDVGAGPPGWVVLPTDFDSDWSLHGRHGVQLADGVVAVPAGASSGHVDFSGWAVVRLGYLVTLLTVVGLGVGVIGFRRRSSSRSP